MEIPCTLRSEGEVSENRPGFSDVGVGERVDPELTIVVCAPTIRVPAGAQSARMSAANRYRIEEKASRRCLREGFVSHQAGAQLAPPVPPPAVSNACRRDATCMFVACAYRSESQRDGCAERRRNGAGCSAAKDGIS